MLKKCFAVASIAAVNLVFAFTGCSSTTTVTEDAGGDAKKEASSSSSGNPVPEAAPPPEAGPACPPDSITGTLAQYDATFGFKLPIKAEPPVCDEANIKTMEANFQEAQKWTDLVKNIPQACADCILTPKDKANYGVVVTISADGAQGFSNFGACFAHFTQLAIDGGNADTDAAACGKGMNYTELCIREACDCAVSDAEQTACIQKALGTGGVCRPFGAGLSACKLSSAEESYCNSLINGARVLCAGGTVSDAGTD
ncbi:MAG: hypothetical protein R3B36_03070 [Polyangiaceae bacterium]